MTLALGAFVWGLASHPYTRTHTHTHRLPITSPHHHLPLNPLHLWLSAPRLPARQSSSYGVTATRDWPTPDKGDVDWQASTEDCVQRVRALGGEMVDDACQSVSPWITLLPTWESATSLSVYLYIWFELLSATKSLFSPLKAERKLSAPQREIIALDCGEAQLFAWMFFSQIKRYHLEALSFLKISSPTPGIFLKHEKCFDN